jgi:hypothetical protein
VDFKAEIARLRDTANLLGKYPELGEKFGALEPTLALFAGYPSDKLEELLCFLDDNKIDFTVVGTNERSQTVYIHVAGILYAFSNRRVVDLSERAANILFEGPLDYIGVELGDAEQQANMIRDTGA